MDFQPTATSDEEMLRIVDQWEAEGLLDPSWMQTQQNSFAALSSSSSLSTPSETFHRNSYPFPSSETASTNSALFSPTTIEEHEDDTPTTDRSKPFRDPAKRKQQNRDACASPLPSVKLPLLKTHPSQRAHRDRQKKLIRDLWAEVHSLRLQNKQLLGLKMESHDLKVANGRLRREIEAIERIWMESVTHGEMR